MNSQHGESMPPVYPRFLHSTVRIDAPFVAHEKWRDRVGCVVRVMHANPARYPRVSVRFNDDQKAVFSGLEVVIVEPAETPAPSVATPALPPGRIRQEMPVVKAPVVKAPPLALQLRPLERELTADESAAFRLINGWLGRGIVPEMEKTTVLRGGRAEAFERVWLQPSGRELVTSRDWERLRECKDAVIAILRESGFVSTRPALENPVEETPKAALKVRHMHQTR